MFNISDNCIINVTRGDSFELPLFLNQGTNVSPMRYVLTDKDEVYVGATECNQPFESALIRKKFTYKDLYISSKFAIFAAKILQTKESLCYERYNY